MKVHTSISIESELIEKAREYGINISAETEKAIKEKINSKKNLPESAIVIKCSQCHKEIEEGFLCPERELILCNECQKTFNMRLCPFDKMGEHYHVKWPGYDMKNELFLPKIAAIAQSQTKTITEAEPKNTEYVRDY